MPLQLKKLALRYPVFFLWIGVQWLFCEESLGLRAGEREKQTGTMLVDDNLSDKKTAVAVRMTELPDAEVITVFSDAGPDGRRDQLWDRDVAEVFLQPDPSQLRRYKEFEVSPNGFWIDLDIGSGQKHDLKSGLRRRVILNEAAKTWVAEMALPMNCLVDRFDPAAK